MRVLVTNHHLRDHGGSELYTYTLHSELTRRGFDVDVFTFFPGPVSEAMSGLVDSATLSARPKGYYDIAFVNHRTCQRPVRRFGVAKRLITTLHGVYPWQEQPLNGADAYVAVSEEVQAHANAMGFEASVIRNGIDTTKFADRTPLNPNLRKVLLLSNYAGAEETVASACFELGCEFEHVGKYTANTHYTWDVAERINTADLVVAVGRGALEGLACGRNVVVYDNRLYVGYGTGDGFFRVDSGLEMSKNNYSGRRYGIAFTPESLAAEFAKYDAGLAAANRAYVLEHHDIRSQVGKYLELAESLERLA